MLANTQSLKTNYQSRDKNYSVNEAKRENEIALRTKSTAFFAIFYLHQWPGNVQRTTAGIY